MDRVFLVTGRPGIGKTTLVKRLAGLLGGCGVYTEEIRERGRRVGFVAVNIFTGERVPIARLGEGPLRVGRYAVLPEGLERMVRWIVPCDLLFVDEIGPMELKHKDFGRRALEACRTSRRCVATAHRAVAREWAEKLGAKLFVLDAENREDVFREIYRALLGSKGAPPS